jgi:hypothetical protein
MTLNSRERVILYATIAVAGSWLAWIVAIQPLVATWSALQSELESERENFQSKVRVLENRVAIETEFQRIQATIPADESDARTAANVFSEEVVSLAEQIMGGKLRDIGIVESQPFTEARGFEILSFPIKTAGNWESISRLLKAFDQRGFLVRSVVLTPRSLDNPEILCDIVLSRVVKISERQGIRRPGVRRPGVGSRP